VPNVFQSLGEKTFVHYNLFEKQCTQTLMMNVKQGSCEHQLLKSLDLTQ